MHCSKPAKEQTHTFMEKTNENQCNDTSLRLAKHVRTTRIKSVKDPYSLSVHSLQRYIEIHVHKSIQKTDTLIHMYKMRKNNGEEEEENANASRANGI